MILIDFHYNTLIRKIITFTLEKIGIFLAYLMSSHIWQIKFYTEKINQNVAAFTFMETFRKTSKDM
jgi:hypothetical protein